MGHGTDTSEQGGEQVPMPVRYDVRKGETGRRCCRTHSGRSSEQREPPRNPATEAMEQKQKENRNRERSSESVRQHFVLSTRDHFFFFVPSFYSSWRGRLALTTYQPNLPTSDPRMYLLRPCMLLGARVCEESVHTPWCFNSSRGRFSSRQRMMPRTSMLQSMFFVGISTFLSSCLIHSISWGMSRHQEMSYLSSKFFEVYGILRILSTKNFLRGK